MTLDEAKRRVLDAAFDNEADAARLESGDDLQRAEARTLRADAEAFRALLSALGEPTAEAREAAAKVAEHYGYVTRGCETIKPGEAAQTIADAIRALSAPAARTYEDGVRDAAKVATRTTCGKRCDCCDTAHRIAYEIERLLSPASGAGVSVRTTSRAESEETARVMHAAAEWHARGYDLVPVKRRNDHA